jgi:hypothetical protein
MQQGSQSHVEKNALIQLMFLEFLLRMVLLLSNNNLTMQTLLQNLLHQM